jgi:hypothetical protein
MGVEEITALTSGLALGSIFGIYLLFDALSTDMIEFVDNLEVRCGAIEIEKNGESL